MPLNFDSKQWEEWEWGLHYWWKVFLVHLWRQTEVIMPLSQNAQQQNSGQARYGGIRWGGQTPYDCSESELSLRLCSATLSQSTNRNRQGPSVSSYRAGAEVGQKPFWNTDMSSSSALKASPSLSACKFPGSRMYKKTKSKGQRTLIHTSFIYHWASV